MTGPLYNWGSHFIPQQQVTRVNWSLRNWFSQVSFRDNPYTVTPLKTVLHQTHTDPKKKIWQINPTKKTSNSDDDHTQLKKNHNQDPSDFVPKKNESPSYTCGIWKLTLLSLELPSWQVDTPRFVGDSFDRHWRIKGTKTDLEVISATKRPKNGKRVWLFSKKNGVLQGVLIPAPSNFPCKFGKKNSYEKKLCLVGEIQIFWDEK